MTNREMAESRVAPPAEHVQVPDNGHGQALTYTRWAAIVTLFLYTAGYAAVGFGLLFFGALWSLVRYRRLPWQPTPLDLPLAAFGAILVVSALASPFRVLALGVTLMLLISGAVYYGAFGWLLGRDPGARSVLLRAWALGAVPAALFGLAVGAATHGRGQIPHGVGPNGLGTTLLLGSVLSLGLAFGARGWTRMLLVAAALVGLVALLATGSRASLVGWGVGAAYLIWQELRGRPWRMASALVIGSALLALAVVTVPQFSGRVATTLSDVSQNRIQIWRTSHRMISARPVLGTGFGAFEQSYEAWKAPGMSREPFAFNLALNIAVETGLAGLVTALWVAVTAAAEWMRAGRPSPARLDPVRPTVVALWIGLLVNQLADNTLFSISTSAGLWLLLALLVVSASSNSGRYLRPTHPEE